MASAKSTDRILTMMQHSRVAVTLVKPHATLVNSRAKHHWTYNSSRSASRRWALSQAFRTSQSLKAIISTSPLTLTQSRPYAQTLNYEQREAAAKAKLGTEKGSPNTSSALAYAKFPDQQQYFTPPAPSQSKTRKNFRSFVTGLAVIYILTYGHIYYTYRTSQAPAPFSGRQRYIDEEVSQRLISEARNEVLIIQASESPACVSESDMRSRDARSLVGRLAATQIMRDEAERISKAIAKGGTTSPDGPWRMMMVDIPYQPFIRSMGGNVIQLSTGWLAHLSTEPRLAACLATMMARQACKHKLENRSRKALLESLAAPISPILAACSLVLGLFGITTLIASTAKLRYYQLKRQQCYEADTMALRILYEAGYDVHELVNYYKDVQENQTRQEVKAKQTFMGVGIMWSPPSEDELNAPYPISRAHRIEEQIPALLQENPQRKTWLLGSAAGGPMRYGIWSKAEAGAVDEDGKPVGMVADD